MNYLTASLGIAFAATMITTAAIYRADAADWKSKYTALQASYSAAANKARLDAQAQEAKDTAALKLQSSQAISQALQGQKTAETALQSYLARGNAASRGKDLGHQCFSVPIPADEIP